MKQSKSPPPSNYKRDARSAPDATTTQIERIDTLTRTARTSWFGLISYLAFVGVTLLGVEDADFFIPERQTQLPLVGVSIPTLLFFAIAPALGAALYAYFHLHLLKLWDALNDALPPAPNPPRRGLLSHFPPLRGYEPNGPDDRPLGDRIAPWLVTDLALSYRTDGLTHRPLRWIALLATGFLSFLAGPLVLFFFWLWSMPAHNELLTVVGCGIPLSLSIVTCISSWRQMHHRVREVPAITPLMRRLRYTAAWVGFAAVTVVGWLTTEGSFANYAMNYFGHDAASIEGKWWADDKLNKFLVPASLANVNFVNAPPEFRTHDVDKAAFRRNWCATEEIPPHRLRLAGERRSCRRASYAPPPTRMVPRESGAEPRSWQHCMPRALRTSRPRIHAGLDLAPQRRSHGAHVSQFLAKGLERRRPHGGKA